MKSSAGLLATAVSNGYDAEKYADFERVMIKEREKMLAEHKASQEKQRTVPIGDSTGHHDHRGNHSDSKLSSRVSGYQIPGGGERREHHHHDKTQHHTHQHSKTHHTHQQHDKLHHKNTHKTLLHSDKHNQSTSSYISQLSSGKTGSKYQQGPTAHYQPLTSHVTFNSQLSHVTALTSQPLSSQVSALTSLQNFSNSKVPGASYGRVTSDGEHKHLKDTDTTRVNGALTHSNRHHSTVRTPTKRKAVPTGKDKQGEQMDIHQW